MISALVMNVDYITCIAVLDTALNKLSFFWMTSPIPICDQSEQRRWSCMVTPSIPLIPGNHLLMYIHDQMYLYVPMCDYI